MTSASGDAGGSAEGKAEGKGGSGRRGGKRGAADKAEQPTVLVTTIVNKDLFDASRQKPTEEAKAPPPPKEIGPPPNLTLVGVRMVGRDFEAFVADVAQGNQQRRLRVGDEVGGYTLKTIHPSRVSLASAAGESLTLTLNIEKSGGGGAETAWSAGRTGRPAASRPARDAAGWRHAVAGRGRAASRRDAPVAGRGDSAGAGRGRPAGPGPGGAAPRAAARPRSRTGHPRPRVAFRARGGAHPACPSQLRRAGSLRRGPKWFPRPIRICPPPCGRNSNS